MSRSHKPIVWGLFAAGGTLAAFVLPALIAITCLAVPLGLLNPELLSYESLQAGLAHPLTRLVLFGMLSVILWHAAHRMRITAHDVGIRADMLMAVIFYSIAAAGTILLATSLIALG